MAHISFYSDSRVSSARRAGQDTERSARRAADNPVSTHKLLREEGGKLQERCAGLLTAQRRVSVHQVLWAANLSLVPSFPAMEYQAVPSNPTWAQLPEGKQWPVFFLYSCAISRSNPGWVSKHKTALLLKIPHWKRCYLAPITTAEGVVLLTVVNTGGQELGKRCL